MRGAPSLSVVHHHALPYPYLLVRRANAYISQEHLLPGIIQGIKCVIRTYASKVVIIIPHPKTPLHFQTATPAKQGVYRSKTLYALNSFNPHIHPPCSLINCKHRSIGRCHLSISAGSILGQLASICPQACSHIHHHQPPSSSY